ncbi:DUF6234 family protein [Streptomyces sp. NPDC059568]|uniref:DUF6234 family protein n=1 Tax=Streptomyces sp. NPDC059568 TaxID=3346868 RepID=UPI0036B1027B
MAWTPGSRIPSPPPDKRRRNPSNTCGDWFEGGCLGLLMLLLETLAALMLGVALGLRTWSRSSEYANSKARVATPPMDWVPTLWTAGFTLAVLAIAIIFFRAAHPFAGSVQLLVAALALCVTVAAWHDSYERAHPAPDPAPSPSYDPGRSGQQCRSGGDSHECVGGQRRPRGASVTIAAPRTGACARVGHSIQPETSARGAGTACPGGQRAHGPRAAVIRA